MVTTSNLFMTKNVVQVVGNFCSLRYLHDYDFIFRVMLAFPNGIEYVKDEKLLYYRIHDGNTLGEAAIIGRNQDKGVIKKYMLHRLPEEYKLIASTGADRLIEIEQELSEVRHEMFIEEGFGIKESFKFLLKALRKKLK